jgi:hypothetical protein
VSEVQVGFERETINSAGRVAHDVGLGAILGGNLFARIGMHPALREVSDPRERGKVVNAAWRRYGTINSLALAALIAGWAGSRVGEADREGLSERECALRTARGAALAAVAVTGVAAGIQGVRFSGMEPEGAIPLEDGSEPEAGASRGESRAKRRLNLLGALHLASALTLAGVNALLREAGPAPGPRSRRRRFLRR